jgi:magnesium-transporting ATPase (P-type)
MANRPGGLTALAVLNFVFAGLSALGVLAMVVLLQFADQLKKGSRPEDRLVLEAFENMSMPVWALVVLSSAIATVLLIAAGVGYLKMRRWGRTAGLLYAVTAIISSVLTVVMLPTELGGGFNFGTIIGVVYPILTLILVGKTFKDDLTTSAKG